MAAQSITKLEEAFKLLLQSKGIEVPKLRERRKEVVAELFQIDEKLKLYGATVEPEKVPQVDEANKEKVLEALKEADKPLSVKALQKATDMDQVKLGKVRKALIAEGKIKEEKDENNRLQTNISLAE